MAPMIRSMRTYSTRVEYSVDFFGDDLIVTVTADSSVISQWISDVAFYRRFSAQCYQPLVVGVGVQWTPAGYFYDSPPPSYDSPPPSYDSPPQRSYYSNPPADTLQLCVGNRCIIIQLSHCDEVPEELHSFLEDEETTFVGVWNSQDARMLKECRHQLLIGDLIDLRKHVIVDSQGRSLTGCSFEVIVETCLGHQGVRLDRAISMSNWSVYNLCDEQILQASIDAYVCAKLGVHHRLWEV